MALAVGQTLQCAELGRASLTSTYCWASSTTCEDKKAPPWVERGSRADLEVGEATPRPITLCHKPKSLNVMAITFRRDFSSSISKARWIISEHRTFRSIAVTHHRGDGEVARK